MRWTQHLQDPDFKKGRWSPEEDVTLKAAHAKLGDKFPENAALVPGRDGRAGTVATTAREAT